ncbi:MAG: hypothetical protein Ct9H300mP1_11070 [Planctomycetaceae bacterium]|nr:MAG: hypothetical protein Ct9H300mP1_11070 [Planctomycetaceae bacterium]
MRRQTILQAVGPLLIVAAGVFRIHPGCKHGGLSRKIAGRRQKPPPVRTRVLGPPGKRGFEISLGGPGGFPPEVTLSAEGDRAGHRRPDNPRAGPHVPQGGNCFQIDPVTTLELRKITSPRGVDPDPEKNSTESPGSRKMVFSPFQKRAPTRLQGTRPV